jgi:putative tryptophan/tyrosine transport system substrate-binding protein
MRNNPVSEVLIASDICRGFMKRRDFIKIIATAAAIWPRTARSQQSSNGWLIGVLSPITKTAAARNVEALRDGLRELGYSEDRNIKLEIRYADGDIDRLPQLAAELVKLGPAVIVAGSPPAAIAAHNATRTIPIVMNSSPDPVALGLASSIARPGDNVTGFWWGDPALTGKRLELLKQAVPGMARAGLIFNPDDPTDSGATKVASEASKSLSLTIRFLEVRSATEFDEAFTTAKREGVQGLTMASGPLFVSFRAELAKMALAAGLPVIGGFRDFALVGTLASYGASLSDLYRRKAEFIDKILRGAKPAELPIERPTKFELLINLKTAKALGLTIAPSLLLLADEVIE